MQTSCLEVLLVSRVNQATQPLEKKKESSNKQLIFTLGRKGEKPNSKLEEGVKIVKISSQISIQKRKTKEINFKQKLLQTGEQK